MKTIWLTAIVAAAGVLAGVDAASAGLHNMEQKVRYSVGCPVQGGVIRAMKRHPERYGKVDASLLAQYPNGAKR